MAAQAVLNGSLAWYSEVDPGACQVLAHRHPAISNLGDVTAIDWAAVPPVDVLDAGFPCQDISDAGRRAGITGERSGLWTHVTDAVRVLRPQLVILENVAALLVRGLGRVAADLAEVGYDLRWTCVRASDVGAPHRRERWFGYATPADAHNLGRERHWGTGPADHGVFAANAYCPRPQRTESAGGRDVPARRVGSDFEWGQFAPAIRRWEAILGRSAPDPTEPGRRNNRVLSPQFVEWLMGLPPGWVTEVPGLSRRQQLRLLGNGVVPQQGAAAIEALHIRRNRTGRWAA
ncbi:DNA (cytosine-5)-methyltransferase 1 [Lentzea californiensis]|nr:DNA (cytosine-5)-methyltransferase 1 [Lentzea californiensis]